MEFPGDGSDDLAADRLQDYLARTGDPIEIPHDYEEGVFEGFGDTPWRASDQVEFLSNFLCAPGAEPVLEAMGKINPEQSRGLGTLPGARFKGGWGEEFDGTFLYRQMGLISVAALGSVPGAAIDTTPGMLGFVPVAVITIPTEGTEESALEVMDAAAAEIFTLLPRLTPVGWNQPPNCS